MLLTWCFRNSNLWAGETVECQLNFSAWHVNNTTHDMWWLWKDLLPNARHVYLPCYPAAEGLVPGCCRLRLAAEGSGLPGWTVEVQLANPPPQPPRRPVTPTLSPASATRCQSHSLAGRDKQAENCSNSIDSYHAKRNREMSRRTQAGLNFCDFFLLPKWKEFKKIQYGVKW